MKISKNQKNQINKNQKHFNLDLLITSNIDLNQLKNYINDNKELINYTDKKGESLLSYNIARNNIEIIQYILSKDNLNLNYYDKKGSSYLHKAIQYSNYLLIKQLIEKGININNQDNKGNTPLHLATMKNDIKSIKILLNNNANIHIINKNEETPLIIAQNLGYLKLINALNNTKVSLSLSNSNTYNHNISPSNIISNDKIIDLKKINLLRQHSDGCIIDYKNKTYPKIYDNYPLLDPYQNKSKSINVFKSMNNNLTKNNLSVFENTNSISISSKFNGIKTENNLIYKKKKLNNNSVNTSMKKLYISNNKCNINIQKYYSTYIQADNNLLNSNYIGDSVNVYTEIPTNYNQIKKYNQIYIDNNYKNSKDDNITEIISEASAQNNSNIASSFNYNSIYRKANKNKKEEDESILLSYSVSQSIFSLINKETLLKPGELLYSVESINNNINLYDIDKNNETIKFKNYNINICVNKLIDSSTCRSNNLFSYRKNINRPLLFYNCKTFSRRNRHCVKNEIKNNSSKLISKDVNKINNELYLLLREIKLEKYYSNLLLNGFDDIYLLIEQFKNKDGITLENLKETNINLLGDRAKIIVYFTELSNNFPFNNYNKERIFVNNNNKMYYNELFNWLKDLKMECFINNFINCGYYSLDLLLIQMLTNQPINEYYLNNELLINKVGYKTRILSRLKEDSSKYSKTMINKYGANNKYNKSIQQNNNFYIEITESNDKIPCKCSIF